jgi:hypothetical protein
VAASSRRFRVATEADADGVVFLFDISDFGFEVQDSSIFEIFYLEPFQYGFTPIRDRKKECRKIQKQSGRKNNNS